MQLPSDQINYQHLRRHVVTDGHKGGTGWARLHQRQQRVLVMHLHRMSLDIQRVAGEVFHTRRIVAQRAHNQQAVFHLTFCALLYRNTNLSVV